nr:meiosis-specific topoisomerase [Farysia itapuensis]
MSAFLSEEIRTDVLSRIDDLIAGLIDQLQLHTDQPSMNTLKLTSHKSGTVAPRTPLVRWPTKAVKGMLRFAQYLRVLELVQSALRQCMFVTKRSIYYQSMHLFDSQQASDNVVEQLVVLLGCKDRSQLGVIASPRGLVAGNLVITHEHTPSIKIVPGRATLIPPEIVTQTDWHVRLDAAQPPKLIILVEKETVFKTLVQLQQRGSLSDPLRKSIIVTGRGYADQAARVLINLLAETELRCVGLFDCDPYGIDIHRHYRLACPSADIQRLGVNLPHFLPSSDESGPEKALIPLRTDERLKAVSLLQKLTRNAADASDSPVTQDWICMLTDMVLHGYKIEVEACYTWHTKKNGDVGLAAYIAHRLAQFP